MIPSSWIRAVRPALRLAPGARGLLRSLDESLSRAHHALAERFPAAVRPAPRQITIAITARCNLRCIGCRYERDFMLGAELPLALVKDALADARAAGVHRARFFGGEPLLHPDLPAMVREARALGLDAYLTTNGLLLGKRVAELREAGLAWLTIGFYGIGDEYDRYAQRPGSFAALRASLAETRARAGAALEIQLNWVLSRRSGSVRDLEAAWALAEEFGLHFSVDPVSETIPFFANPGRDLHFEPEHESALREVSAALVRLKADHPGRLPQSAETLRALPDLLLRPREARVPCDAYELVWIGADGSIQLCDTAFPLGNLHATRLRDVLFGPAHCAAARAGFRLQCPACHCKIDSRIRRHGPSRRRWSAPARA